MRTLTTAALSMGLCILALTACTNAPASRDESSFQDESPAPAASQELEDYIIELDPQYNLPTEELLELFPIKYQTPANTDMEKKIQNRMLNGFNRWNMGYEAWEHWGEVLYYPDSIYNVNGVRLTLPEYQQAMNASLNSTDIQMGSFNNMILSGDWMAIRYDTISTNRETGETSYGTTMEFARFKDFGEKGAKVDEGWGGVKNAGYSGIMHFQTEEEQAAQKAFMDELIRTKLPDTDNLEEKYPVVYPTPIDTELGRQMKAAILNDFEHWNSGWEEWSAWADTLYTTDVTYNLNGEDLDRNGLKDAVKATLDTSARVRINNILISDDWAAVHFWDVSEDENGEKSAANHMQFLHFTQKNGTLQVDMCWAK